MSKQRPHVGRFAPSPTGNLHFGSLLAAVASYCQARTQNGQWRVRIEDLDPPREIPGATRRIIDTLHRFGFEIDGPVILQSAAEQQARYLNALEQLHKLGVLFYCRCNRKALRDQRIYPGTCRKQKTRPSEAASVRLRVTDEEICFNDCVQGQVCQNLAEDCGDFNVRRKDGLICYQLAVVVDDAQQQITEVVRGSDLLDSTPRQIYLNRLLGFPTPDYMHIPVATGTDGHKLSKQAFADEIHDSDPVLLLPLALRFLGQRIPDAACTSVRNIWSWATQHWNPECIPKTMQRPCPLNAASAESTRAD